MWHRVVIPIKTHFMAQNLNPNPLPAQDLDPEALAALPADIRHELRVALASRRGALPGFAAQRAGAQGSRARSVPAKRARGHAPGPMERFITRRTG